MATALEDLTTTQNQPAFPNFAKFDDFVDWAFAQEEEYEWVDGKVITMAPASYDHEDLFSFLLTLLRLYVRKRKLGNVLGSRYLIHLPTIRRGREPDLLFFATERQALAKKNYFDGAPDLVVEIISPGSIKRDRDDKYEEYEAAGVREYWLIDPDHLQADFYFLGDDALYHPLPLEAGNIMHSKVIAGFWLKTDWLWLLPEEAESLAEIESAQP